MNLYLKVIKKKRAAKQLQILSIVKYVTPGHSCVLHKSCSRKHENPELAFSCSLKKERHKTEVFPLDPFSHLLIN